MNIFLVIMNIEYYNLLNFYVLLFNIFGKKIIYKKKWLFLSFHNENKIGLIAFKFFVGVDFIHLFYIYLYTYFIHSH